ncbi:MAG TPA: hypothetical protein VFM82_03615 [Flavobacteriaceae bacterium]|nr:hypothetical protein [Flavobacteriaceae bacterium]
MNTDSKKNGTEQCTMPSVSGSFLRIYEHTHRRQKHLASNSNFFADDVKIEVDDYCIYITRPSLDYRGKTFKAHNRNGIYHTAIVDERLECGEFEFDADKSTEDCLVVNYR